jgi:cytochrome c
MAIRHTAIAATLALALVGCGTASDTPDTDAGEAESPAAIVAATGAALGEKLFLQCRACHSVNAGDADGVGPNLYGAFDAKAGAREKYAYSDAMKSSGIIWTRDNLDAFLAHPTAKVPGTKMAFAGVSDPKHRAALIDYMADLKGGK